MALDKLIFVNRNTAHLQGIPILHLGNPKMACKAVYRTSAIMHKPAFQVDQTKDAHLLCNYGFCNIGKKIFFNNKMYHRNFFNSNNDEPKSVQLVCNNDIKAGNRDFDENNGNSNLLGDPLFGNKCQHLQNVPYMEGDMKTL